MVATITYSIPSFHPSCADAVNTQIMELAQSKENELYSNLIHLREVEADHKDYEVMAFQMLDFLFNQYV